jgi:hypothetical protein
MYNVTAVGHVSVAISADLRTFADRSDPFWIRPISELDRLAPVKVPRPFPNGI